MYLIFDTETTGLPQDFKKSYQDLDNWSTARCVQLSWQLHDRLGKLIDSGNDIIKPDGFDIPQASIKIHRITNEMANEKGISVKKAIDNFDIALEKALFIIGHNITFDINVMGAEYHRAGCYCRLHDLRCIDTMKTTVDYCKIRIGKEGIIKDVSPYGKFKEFYKYKVLLKGGDSGILYKKTEIPPNFNIGEKVSYEINNKGTIKVRKGFKSPKLEELYETIFQEKMVNAHDAAFDVDATARCFFELLRTKFYSSEETNISKIDIDDFILNNQSKI